MFRFALTTAVTLIFLGSLVARAALAEQVKFEGRVEKIEGDKVIVKEGGNREQHMEIVPATKIVLDGRAAKPSDLKVGHHVSCTCEKQGDRMTCRTIEAKTN
jgi:hypothetical protein